MAVDFPFQICQNSVKNLVMNKKDLCIIFLVAFLVASGLMMLLLNAIASVVIALGESLQIRNETILTITRNGIPECELYFQHDYQNTTHISLWNQDIAQCSPRNGCVFKNRPYPYASLVLQCVFIVLKDPGFSSMCELKPPLQRPPPGHFTHDLSLNR